MPRCMKGTPLLAHSGTYKIDDGRNDSCNDDPEELEPIKKRNAYQLWRSEIVKGWPEQSNEWDEEQ